MKVRALLLLPLLLYGCGDTPSTAPSDPAEEVVKETVTEPKKRYPTLDDYVAVIEFQDGKKITDPTKVIFYDAGNGIESIHVAKFYKKHANSEETLENKRKELGEAIWLQNLKSSPPKNTIHEFLQQKTVESKTKEGEPKDLLQLTRSVVQQARVNKKLLDKLSKKYKQNPKSIKENELQQLIILREENGDYEASNIIWKKFCKKHSESCTSPKLRVQGWVKDDQLEVVPGAEIEILNNPDVGIFKTNASGDYHFEVEVRPYQLVRVRYSATGYMSLIKEIRIGPDKDLYELVSQVRLPRVHKIVELEVGKAGRIDTGLGNAYEFGANTFRTSNGKVYKGKATAYIYSFIPQQSDMGEVLVGALRVSDGVVPQMGLFSFGMAYVSFTTESGEPLQIFKDNPLSVVTYVDDREYFYNGLKWEGASEEVFWDKWISYSGENRGIIGTALSMYPEPYYFPSYWVYNIQTGIWDEVPFRINQPGVIQSILYTHTH